MGLPSGCMFPGEKEGQDRRRTGRPDFTGKEVLELAEL